MQYTTNYSLRKPQLIEPASVADLNANADSIDTLLYQNRHISATEYNQNTSYSVGDLVVYENLLYKCIGATSGNWDSTKWSRTTLASEVELAGQSGGSDVEGNPSGTATAQLEKLRVDNDIFFVNDASKIIAEPYDSTATYAVGDYCIYNTLLYKCTTAVSTAEAFDSTKWTACLVTDEMGSGGGGSANLNEVTQAQYDALTEAQKKNGEMYFITDVNGDGSQFQPVIYSTDEREVGVWTDGKPLYQKTVLIDNIPSSIGIQRFAHGISNIETVMAKNGTWLNKSDSTTYIGTKDIVRPDSPTDNTGVWADATNIVMSTGVNRSNQKLYITIQYTKTTDTPGSGTWTPQGVPAVHYSTDEQVVGTIQNTTLYEKLVITGGSVPTGATLILRTALLNGYDVIQYTKSSS